MGQPVFFVSFSQHDEANQVACVYRARTWSSAS